MIHACHLGLHLFVLLVALTLKALVQEDLTTRTRLRDLPDDEPTKTVDPAPEFGERMFWEGHGVIQ